MEVSREGGLQLFDQILPEATLNLTTYTARARRLTCLCGRSGLGLGYQAHGVADVLFDDKCFIRLFDLQ